MKNTVSSAGNHAAGLFAEPATPAHAKSWPLPVTFAVVIAANLVGWAALIAAGFAIF